MTRKLFLLLVSLLIIAIILVPSQADYFERLQLDFEELHQTVTLDPNSLKKMGEFEYRNSLIFSQFDYTLGNISVSYYGFFNCILFRGSKVTTNENPQITV